MASAAVSAVEPGTTVPPENHRLSQVSTASSTNSKRARAHIGPWQLGRTLGRGSSGRVRLAKHAESGQLAAVKIVPKTEMAAASAGGQIPYGIEREVIIMKLIEHPNVMALYDVWENKGELYLILEYIEGGELFDYLISRGRLSEHEAVHYFRQICYGVDYCHRFNICHRDLKPENLLLDKNRNIKIADFGMAALETSGRMLETSCGSPHYASPEIVAGKTYHGAPSDIWSCGIILFALLTGHLPFDDDNIRQLLLKVQSGRYTMPHSLSAEARDLIARMLRVDPAERISMPEILAHPLLQKYPTRNVPVENGPTRNAAASIDVMHPVRSEADIDREILRNLQTLWHREDPSTIVRRLLVPEPTPEKTFYCLLQRFRQKHGLQQPSSEEKGHRRTASRDSRRSTTSRKSTASRRKRKTRATPRSASKFSVASTASSRRQARVHFRPPKSKPKEEKARKPKDDTPQETELFAAMLDEAFGEQLVTPNPPALGLEMQNPGRRIISEPAPTPIVRTDTKPRVVSGPPTTAGLTSQGPVYPVYPSQPSSSQQQSVTPQYTLQSLQPLQPASTVPTHPGYSTDSVNPLNPTDIGYPGLNMHGAVDQPASSPVSTGVEDTPMTVLDPRSRQDGPSPYLLPMIFEEDRFADALEEEMELKVYKRQRPQPAMASARDNSGNDQSSRLQIANLASGESFCSYQPSAAAAAVSPPTRPAPPPPAPKPSTEVGRAPDRAVHISFDTPSHHVKRKPVTGSNPPSITTGSAPAIGTPHSTGSTKSTAAPHAKSRLSMDQRAPLGVREPNVEPSKPKWFRRFTPKRLSSGPKAAQQAEPASVTRHASSREDHGGEVKQNWFLKMLSGEPTQPSSKLLTSPLPPIELYGVLVRVLRDWRPYGVTVKAVPSTATEAVKKPVDVSILRKNSLQLRPSTIQIRLAAANTASNKSTATFRHLKGSHTSYTRLVTELERLLNDRGVLSSGS